MLKQILKSRTVAIGLTALKNYSQTLNCKACVRCEILLSYRRRENVRWTNNLVEIPSW